MNTYVIPTPGTDDPIPGTDLPTPGTDDSTPEPDGYRITYKLNGGTYQGNSDNIVETYPTGMVIDIHEKPERNGYTFLYWKGSEYQPGDKYTVTEGHVFTAIWELSETAERNSTVKMTPGDSGNTEGKTHDSGSPKSGDSSNALYWLILLLLSAAGLTGMSIDRRR